MNELQRRKLSWELDVDRRTIAAIFQSRFQWKQMQTLWNRTSFRVEAPSVYPIRKPFKVYNLNFPSLHTFSPRRTSISWKRRTTKPRAEQEQSHIPSQKLALHLEGPLLKIGTSSSQSPNTCSREEKHSIVMTVAPKRISYSRSGSSDEKAPTGNIGFENAGFSFETKNLAAELERDQHSDPLPARSYSFLLVERRFEERTQCSSVVACWVLSLLFSSITRF